MKRWLILFVLLLLSPSALEAKSSRFYEKWEFRTEEDINDWNIAGLEKVEIMADGLRFDVNEQAALFRLLPEGFVKNVDALRVQFKQLDGLEEAAILFITLNAEGEIASRVRLILGAREEGGMEYIPLDFYPKELYNADVFALSLKGNANGVVFGGVRFLHYTTFEKIAAVWRSFWTFESLNAHSINLIFGPVITTDGGPFDKIFQWQTYATSANAYFLLLIALAGIALLFYAFVQTHRGRDWTSARRSLLINYFLLIGAIWLLYDFRMGLEFVRNVAQDHVQYIAAPVSERTFREHGRFYDFVEFADEFIADREGYEIFLPDIWPYYGAIKYLTYPRKPNKDEPIYDTWLIFDRWDIYVDDGRLFGVDVDAPFSRRGEILERFDDTSFIFREFPKSS